MEKTCEKGHRFQRKSNCDVCPICEKERKPEQGFLSLLSAPARRALEAKAWTDLTQLSQQRYSEIAQLHGMGPKAMKLIREHLEQAGLSFKE